MSDVRLRSRSTATSGRRSRPRSCRSQPRSTAALQLPDDASRSRPRGRRLRDARRRRARRRLGQVLSLELHSEDATGPGLPQVRIRVGARRGGGAGRGRAAVPRRARCARRAPDEVRRVARPRSRPERAPLEVGELALARGVPFGLDAAGFGRHTFLCGQSGSGKTYSLGVLLERLLMETSLRVVVLDPNSDYVRLGETRAGADAETAERFRRRGGLGRGAERHERARRRSASASASSARRSRRPLLRLDPLADREEYAELTALVEDEGIRSLADLDACRVRGAEAARRATWASTAGASGPGPEGESLAAEPRGPRRTALPRRRPRLARHARGAGARSPAPCSSGSGAGAPRASRSRS